MEFKNFKIVIDAINGQYDKLSKLYNLDVDLFNFNDDMAKVIDIFWNEIYTPDGCDWINWFLYEKNSPGGEILTAHDADGNEICTDTTGLWEMLENEYKKKEA